MARRTVPTFEGFTATLSTEKVEAIERQFAIAMGDEDKAGDVDDAAYYEGWANALHWVLEMLYDVNEGDSDD